MPQVSSIWMIRAGDGRQPRIIQRAGIRQAAMPGTPRGASRHGSGHPGSGGCGCPERPLPRSGITLSDDRGQEERAHCRRSGRFGLGDVLRSRPLVTGDSVAASIVPSRCPSAGGRIARSRRGGRGRTGDLGPCRPGPTPAEPPRGSANVKIAQGKGTRRDTEGEPEPGQRPKGTNRRTPDEGKPEEGGRRGRTRRANGKPEESPQGEPEDVR